MLKIKGRKVDHYDIQAFLPHDDGQTARKGFTPGIKTEEYAIAEIVKYWLQGYTVYVLAAERATPTSRLSPLSLKAKTKEPQALNPPSCGLVRVEARENE